MRTASNRRRFFLLQLQFMNKAGQLVGPPGPNLQ